MVFSKFKRKVGGSALPFSGFNDLAGLAGDAGHGVASIDDEIRVCGEFGEVEGGVVGGDDDSVLGGEILRSPRE